MYKVTVNGSKPFFEERDKYEAGEKVSMRFMVPTDVNTNISSKDVKVELRYEDGVFIGEFEMPDHDVDIDYRLSGSMTQDPHAQKPAIMGMMGAAMEGMMSVFRKKQAEQDPNAEKKYCSCCGAKLEPGVQYCGECGAKI